MICPQCESEYREGFSICAECNVRLVPDLEHLGEEVGEDGELQLVLLLDTASIEHAEEVVRLLEKNEIPYVLHSGTALNLNAGNFHSLTWRANLSVPQISLRKAKKLIERLENH